MRARTLTDDYRNGNNDNVAVEETKVTFEDNKMDEEEKASISGLDSDEKSSPPEYEKDAPPEYNGEGALPEKDESSAVPDTNKENGEAESSGAAGEGNDNSTTVELACQETDL